MATTPKDYAFKYDKVNPFSKLHEGEPWFFIRAQDRLASEAVQAYADLLKRESDKAYRDGDEELSKRLLKQSLGIYHVIDAISDWQADHADLVKTPG